MRRALLLATTMAITALLAVGIASADPVKSKHAQFFTLDCGGQEVTVVTLENNNAPLLQVVEGTSNFHITELTFTILDPDTDEILFVDTLSTGQGNRTGLQDDLVTCTAPEETFVDPETGETLAFIASAEGFFTPRGH